VLAGAAAGQPVAASTPDRALVRLCLAALVVVLAWAWLQGMAGVAEAWRGAAPATERRAVRRLVLVACGAALAGSLVPPAHATPDGPRGDRLSGLPLPDRPEGRARPVSHQVVVRPGDSLWALAERDLRPPGSDRQVTRRWQAIYHRNRGVIGPDPDLIRPGQVLEIPKEHP
jgi:nucleoid-associated protein YgaU